MESANSGASASGRPMPLPVLKPKVPAIEAKKQDGKAKAESAIPGGSATGRQMPLPAPKSKTPEIEIKKQDDKGTAESASVGEIAAGGKQKGRGRAVWGSGPYYFGDAADGGLRIVCCTTSKSENPAGGKRGFQIQLLGVRGNWGNRLVRPCLPRGCFRRISSQRIWFRGLRQRSRPAFRSLWLESGTHGDIIEPQLEPVISGRRSSGIAADAHIPLDGAPSSANSCLFDPRDQARCRGYRRCST